MGGRNMKRRLPYIMASAVSIVLEILIGAFVKDAFIRPYVGDVLVTVLLCCLIRCVIPEGWPWLPVGVFGFSVAVECFQLLTIPGVEGTILGVLLGSTFDLVDILCYGIGCALFRVGETIVGKIYD